MGERKGISGDTVLCYCVLLLGGVSGGGERSEWVEGKRGFWMLDVLSYMSYRTEPQIFKTRFKSWDDILTVDFTCTPEMLEKRKVELVCFHGVCLGLSVCLSGCLLSSVCQSACLDVCLGLSVSQPVCLPV